MPATTSSASSFSSAALSLALPALHSGRVQDGCRVGGGRGAEQQEGMTLEGGAPGGQLAPPAQRLHSKPDEQGGGQQVVQGQAGVGHHLQGDGTRVGGGV